MACFLFATIKYYLETTQEILKSWNLNNIDILALVVAQLANLKKV